MANSNGSRKRSPLSEVSLELIGNTVLALSGVALTYYLYYRRFVSEDYWVEYATFVSLALVWRLRNPLNGLCHSEPQAKNL